MLIFNPIHAAPDSFFVMLAFLVIFSLLYIEQRNAWKERHREFPAWGRKAKDNDEFLARVMASLKADKALEDRYTLKIVLLVILGSVSLLFAVLYVLLVAGII